MKNVFITRYKNDKNKERMRSIKLGFDSSFPLIKKPAEGGFLQPVYITKITLLDDYINFPSDSNY